MVSLGRKQRPHSSLGYLTPQEAARSAVVSLPFPLPNIVLHRGHPSTLPFGSLTLGVDGA